MPGDIRDRTTARWGVALVVTTLIVALAAGLFSLAAAPKYVSTVNILVGPVTADVDTLRAAESLTSTYSQVLVSTGAIQEAAESVEMTPTAVTEAADVTFNVETRIVTLRVTTEAPAASRGIATSLTGQLTQLIGTVDPTAPSALSILSVQPQTAEEVPRSALRYAALGGAAWLLLTVGVLAAFASRPGSEVRAWTRRPAAASREASSEEPSERDVDPGAEQVEPLRRDVDPGAEGVEPTLLDTFDDRESVDDRDSLRR